MKKIKLTQGKYATVDDEDYPYLSRFHWVLSNGHASMEVGAELKHHNIYMEYFVKEKGKMRRYIFKDRDPLNLRKENIKVAGWGVSTAASRKTKSETTSKYKGVCWDKREGAWLAYVTIRINGVRKKLLWKFFRDEKSAARARNKKVKEVFGELAYQNKI